MQRTQQKQRMLTENSEGEWTGYNLSSSIELERRPVSRQNFHNLQKSTRIKTEQAVFTDLRHRHPSLASMLASLNRPPPALPQPAPLSQRSPLFSAKPHPHMSPLKRTKLSLIDQLCHSGKKLRETKSTLAPTPKANKLLLKNRIRQFTTLRALGKGRFGEVYLARHDRSGFVGALKVIRKSQVFNQQAGKKQRILNQLISEIRIQSILNHPNLIKLYDFFSDADNVYLFVELGSDGHLYDLLQKRGTFSEETTAIVIREITKGIQYMHTNSFIHRDIKLENIVFTHGMAKICDFGWSVYEPKEYRRTICGTPLYLSPEILQGRIYNHKIDIWALGALTHELITGENPFGIRSKEDLDRIITMKVDMRRGSPQICSFINFILRKEPSRRPDADIVLKHPFIRKFMGLETSQQICGLTYGGS